MSEILLVVPAEVAHDVTLDPTVRVRPYRTYQDVLVALGAPAGSVIILSDLLPAAQLPLVASAIQQASRTVVEVRSDRWDGQAHSPLSAACKGVISGFGLAGVDAAIAFIRREEADA